MIYQVKIEICQLNLTLLRYDYPVLLEKGVEIS